MAFAFVRRPATPRDGMAAGEESVSTRGCQTLLGLSSVSRVRFLTPGEDDKIGEGR
jgi:hypothetical protein